MGFVCIVVLMLFDWLIGIDVVQKHFMAWVYGQNAENWGQSTHRMQVHFVLFKYRPMNMHLTPWVELCVCSWWCQLHTNINQYLSFIPIGMFRMYLNNIPPVYWYKDKPVSAFALFWDLFWCTFFLVSPWLVQTPYHIRGTSFCPCVVQVLRSR